MKTCSKDKRGQTELNITFHRPAHPKETSQQCIVSSQHINKSSAPSRGPFGFSAIPLMPVPPVAWKITDIQRLHDCVTMQCQTCIYILPVIKQLIWYWLKGPWCPAIGRQQQITGAATTFVFQPTAGFGPLKYTVDGHHHIDPLDVWRWSIHDKQMRMAHYKLISERLHRWN